MMSARPQAVLDSVSSFHTGVDVAAEGAASTTGPDPAALAQIIGERLASTIESLPQAASALAEPAAGAAAAAAAAAEPAATNAVVATDPGVAATVAAAGAHATRILAASDVMEGPRGPIDSTRSLALTDGGDDDDDTDGDAGGPVQPVQDEPGAVTSEEAKEPEAVEDAGAATSGWSRPSIELPQADGAEAGGSGTVSPELTPDLRGLRLLPSSRRPTMGNLLAAGSDGSTYGSLADATAVAAGTAAASEVILPALGQRPTVPSSAGDISLVPTHMRRVSCPA